jgi:hypothetical protein
MSSCGCDRNPEGSHACVHVGARPSNTFSFVGVKSTHRCYQRTSSFLKPMLGETTLELIASANDLLAAHAELVSRVRTQQKAHRRQLRVLPAPPQDILRLPLIPSPPHSPATTPPSSPEHGTSFAQMQAQRTNRPDLPPVKRARVMRYANYVPEEETVRNDYAQRYVDGGEWPQNWVLGAQPERRFEELSTSPSIPILLISAFL